MTLSAWFRWALGLLLGGQCSRTHLAPSTKLSASKNKLA